MAESLVHRGPDDGDVWADETCGYAVGFRRLSILDLSPAGRQPMSSTNGRWILVFNGEIYNEADLRTKIEALGHRSWRGHSDTEVLLEAIALWGIEKTLPLLEGMFALAAWDRAERILYLARDRLGEKPLSFGFSGTTFLFGSELQSLARHPDWRGLLSHDALAHFLRRGWIPAPNTVFEGIEKVLPGQVVCLKDGIVTKSLYWNLVVEALGCAASPFSGTEEDAVDALEEALSRSVRSRLNADVPVGAFLSGGIDSSTVAALMRQSDPSKTHTFTVSFPGTPYDEAPFAEAIAKHLGAKHETIPLSETDVAALIPGIGATYDEPFADPSMLPTQLLCKAVRSRVTVALAGDGGDELFGGYRRYLVVRDHFSSAPSPWIQHMAMTLSNKLPSASFDEILTRIGRLVGRTRVSRPMARWERLLARVGAKDFADLMLQDHTRWHGPLPLLKGAPVPFARESGGAFSGCSDPVLGAMIWDAASYLPDDLLTKVDRASMATSLEVRLPFLDTDVLRLAWSLPTSFKIDGNAGKKPLRSLLYRHVPRSLVERPKQGFEPPLRNWLRGPLRTWADDLMSRETLVRQNLVDPQKAETLWTNFRDGNDGKVFPVWHIVVLQAWLTARGF